jgi:HEAT repeat protein
MLTALLLSSSIGVAMDINALLSDLRGDSAPRRRRAVEQLAQAGALAQQAAVALTRLAGDADPQVREQATAALEDVGPPLADQRRELEQLLQSQAAETAYWAATLLGRLGDGQSGPALVAALSNHPVLAVRERAAWALAQMELSPDAIRALKLAAAGREPRLARLARKALQRGGH